MAGTPTAQALVIVDVQSGWLTGPHAVDGAEGLLARLEDGLSAARAGGALVVHVQDVGEADSSVPPGSAGRELALPVLPGDAVLPKAVDDAFVGTGLERLLRERGRGRSSSVDCSRRCAWLRPPAGPWRVASRWCCRGTCTRLARSLRTTTPGRTGGAGPPGG